VTSYVDTKTDEDLVAGEVLYTQGGIKDNNLPPQSKFITISSNVAWYGNIIESAESKPYRLKFSKTADPDSVPESFFEDFESDITGLSSIEDKVVVFTENRCLRLQGTLDDLGRGLISRDTIVDIGAIGNANIITTQDYIYWFSNSGIHRTNGVQYEKLTNHLDETYQEWTNGDLKSRRIYGAYDNVNQRVYWCINESDGDNDKILVFDEIHKGFSTMSSGDDFSPTAILFKDQEMIRADKDGYIFKHSENIFSDVMKSAVITPADWIKKVIPYNWKHIAWDFGDPQAVKWVTKVGVTGRPRTNLYMEPRSFQEGSVDYYSLATIKFNPLMAWGDPTLLWGDPANRWNSVDYLNQAQRMNRRSKRNTHLQMSIVPAYLTIIQSVEDPDSRVNVISASRMITLLNPSIYSFSLGHEGHDVIIDGKAYVIEAGSDSALTVLDPEGTLPDGIYSYEIKGYPKAQRPHLSNLSIHFELFGDMDKLTESV
jgi:hypothetical protein